MEMLLIILSTALQISAAICALILLILIRSSGKRLAWVCIFSAILLTAGLRIPSPCTLPAVNRLLSTTFSELLWLLASGLMLAGVLILTRISAPSRRTGRKRSDWEYADIIRTATDAFWIIDTGGRILEVNDAASGMLGYSREELLEMNVREIDVDMDTETIRRYKERIDKTGRGSFETRHRKKDGAVINIELNAVYMDQDDGLLYVFLRDITGRKKAEEALLASEERFRSIVETSRDRIWETDCSGVYTFTSPKVRDVLGYEIEEIIGKSAFEIMPPDEAERVGRLFKEIARTRMPIERLENTVLSKDGRLVVLETNGLPFFDAAGRLLGYRGLDRDITERREAEKALRESESRYRTISEHYRFLNGIFITFTEAVCLHDLFEIIAKHYQEFTGAKTVIVNRYDEENSSLTLVGIAGVQKNKAEIESILGAELLGLRIPAHNDLKALMKSEMVKRSDDLESITMGAIPRQISDQIFKTMQCEEAIALALHYGSDTVGTAIGFMEKRGAGVPDDLLKTFGQMAGLAITQKGIDEKMKRLNAELEQKVARSTTELKAAYDDLVREVEERKAVENALRRSKDQLNLITDNMLDLVSIFSRDHTYLYASPSHKTILGYEPGELVGKPLSDFLHPEDGEKVAGSLDLIFSSGVTGHVLTQFRNAEGHYQWLESFGSLLRDDTGEVIGMISSSRDVTDRHLLERQLKLSERRFRGLFENSPVSLFELDLSELKATIDELQESGALTLEGFFRENPEIVKRCFKLIRIINLNSTAREIFKIGTTDYVFDEHPELIRQCADAFGDGLLSFLR